MKAVEAMMVGMDSSTDEDSDEEEEEEDEKSQNSTKVAVVNATQKALEEREKLRNEQMHSFEKANLFTIIFSTPSAPDNVQL